MSNAVQKLQSEIVAQQQLRQQLVDQFDDIDPETLADTLEGETDVNELLLILAEEIAEREVLAGAVKTRIDDLQSRKSRIEAGTNTLRAVIEQAMDRCEINKISGDLCTLTLRKTPPKVNILDESAIPSRFWEPQDPKLDRAALKAALDDGEAIDGAGLSNGGISLTIRRK